MQMNNEELFEEYQYYIEKLPKGLLTIMQQIEAEEEKEIGKSLAFFSEGLKWLESAKQYLFTHGIIVNFSLEEINEHLFNLVESMEKRDYIMMSDILEYELIPYFENLKVEN